MSEPARQYHYQGIHFLRKSIAYTDASTALVVGTVPSGSLIIKVMSGAQVNVAFNGSGTDLIDIGTSSNDDVLATNLDVSSIGFKPLDEAVGDYLVSADTVITATYADQNSNASAGSGEIIIAYIPDTDG